MIKTRSIPDWYAADWTPARGRGELPPMTWNAVEDIIADSRLPPSRKDRAKALFRTLWLESSALSPLELLQRFLIVGAVAFDPGRADQSKVGILPTPASGPLPRWSFTDVEVALSYTWSGMALFIATERHHDLLERRGETLSAQDTVRLIVLLVAGLPAPRSVRSEAQPVIASRETRAAA